MMIDQEEVGRTSCPRESHRRNDQIGCEASTRVRADRIGRTLPRRAEPVDSLSPGYHQHPRNRYLSPVDLGKFGKLVDPKYRTTEGLYVLNLAMDIVRYLVVAEQGLEAAPSPGVVRQEWCDV